MEISAPYMVEPEELVVLENAQGARALTIHGIVRPGRLHWPGPWLPRMNLGRQILRDMRPLKIRWGWALLLAIAVVLAMGEVGPAASALAKLP